jgi:hypothetical protein
MDKYRVKARVYTEKTISEGIPNNKWCYRLLLEDDTVRLVEAYNGGGWCNASDDILDPGLFQEIVDEEPGFYSATDDNYEKYVAWIFKDVFYLQLEKVEE